MKKGLLTCLVLLVLVVSCTTLYAADQFNDEAELARKVIQAERRLAVFRVMNLTQEEKTVFWPLYDEYVASIQKINDRMVVLVREYAVAYKDVSDKNALLMLNELLSIEKDKIMLKEDYVKKFEKILPGVKVVRFFQIENKLDLQRDLNLSSRIPLVGPDENAQKM